MNTYLINYNYDGKIYSFNLRAESWNDAEERVFAILDHCWVEGKLEEVVYYEH